MLSIVDEAGSQSSERVYAGTSAADRREDRRRRLIEATLDVVAEQGIRAVAVGVVCEQASVSKRYFYEHFDAVEDLLVATLRSVLAPVVQRIGEIGQHSGQHADDDRRARELIAATVDAVLLVFGDPRAARLYTEAPGMRELREQRDATVDHFVELLLDTLHTPSVRSPGSLVLAHLMVAGTVHVISMWLHGDLPLDREVFVAQIVALGGDAAQRIRDGDTS